MEYQNLDKHFIEPENPSPFYSDGIRIPRKLKKKVKTWCGCYWPHLSNGQALWYYIEKTSPNYKRFLIKKLCER